MEEKNELNDIILNKSGSGSKGKKLLLAIAALTLILIIVLVIMNALKSESSEQPPHAVIPPEPSAPTEIIDDPLFEPVEVIQEGSNTSNGEDLGKIAQKIKQESLENTPVQESEQPVQAAPTPTSSVPAPRVETKSVPAAPASVPAPAPKTEPKPVSKPVAKPAVTAAPKPSQPVITPTIKTVKPAEAKKATETVKAAAVPSKPTTKASSAAVKESEGGSYYIQVGSFTKEPNQALYDRIKASGFKYTTAPGGSATKVLIGPFEGKGAASDSLGTVRKNIEANAFIVKG